MSENTGITPDQAALVAKARAEAEAVTPLPTTDVPEGAEAESVIQMTVPREGPEAAPTQARAVAPNAPVHMPSSTEQGFVVWGPYPDYVIVMTPYGEYAVEPGFVMTFEEYDFWNSKEQMWQRSHRPVYTHFETGLSREETMAGVLH